MNIRKDQHTNPLLVEGAKFYPQALVAISEFCRLVQNAWRETISQELRQLEKAMGVGLSAADIKPYTVPEKISKPIDGKWVVLGVQLIADDWQQLFYLEWNEGQGFGAVAQICFGTSAIAARARAAFERVAQKTYPVFGGDRDKDVFICPEISAPDMDRLTEVTRRVSRDWIRLWREVGGIGQFLDRNVKA